MTDEPITAAAGSHQMPDSRRGRFDTRRGGAATVVRRRADPDLERLTASVVADGVAAHESAIHRLAIAATRAGAADAVIEVLLDPDASSPMRLRAFDRAVRIVAVGEPGSRTSAG